MPDYKAKKLFFESNQFLSQPLQMSLIRKDELGKLNADEESKLRMQVLELKVKLKQEKHPELDKYPMGKQLCFLHYLNKNKERLKEIGVWGDDLTRELEMKQEEEFQKQAEEEVQKRLKEGNVGFVCFLKESTVTVDEIEDSRPTLALSGKEKSQPTLALEDAADDKDSEDETDEDSKIEPPPCPVHLMWQLELDYHDTMIERSIMIVVPSILE